nr:flagellar hook-associated protein FlgK [uncultured Acetobacterium sp.]
MTATFLAYSVASRAMEASQASINIVGNNISNVNTEGYTRQRVDIVSVTTSGMVEKYATPKVSTGIGAKAIRTTQLRDPYIDARYRTQNAEDNRYTTMVKGLSNLEDVFDEASTEALQGELSSFVNDLQSLTQSPTSSDIAQVARSAAEKVTQVINMYATQLEEVRTEQTENLAVVVDSEFNTYVKNIASLNKQIQTEEIYGNTPNELYDQRNLLIDKLSGVANIEVSMSPADVISENLSIPHYSIKIKNQSGGDDIVLVDNDKYSEMSLDSADPLNVQLKIVDTTGIEKTGINSNVIDGSLRGYINLINGKGSFADTTVGESDSKGIYYYSKKMDVFAKQFAKELNAINSDITGATTELPLFTDSTGTSTANITAKNLQVSTAWLKNPSYINTTRNPVIDPPPTADYKATPASADNVLRLIEKMSDKLDFKDSSGNTILTGTFNEYMTGVVSEVATDVELNTNFSKTATNVFQTISDARDAVAGVSLNEEGVNLSAYQKVYNAAMRYFNVLDQNLDNIINRMGV